MLLLLLLLRTRASFTVLLCFMHLLIFQMFFCVILFFFDFILQHIYKYICIKTGWYKKFAFLTPGIAHNFFNTDPREFGWRWNLSWACRVRRFFKNLWNFFAVIRYFEEHWRLLHKHKINITKIFWQIFYDTSICNGSSICLWWQIKMANQHLVLQKLTN